MPNSERDVEFREQDLPLRDDVRFIGALVGEIIKEQGGDALFEIVEAARIDSIANREDASNRSPDDVLADLPTEMAALVARSFTTWFRGVNLVERVHRIRRLRDQLRDGDRPVSEGLEGAFATLAKSGLTLEVVQELVKKLQIEPVLTAHPTQATRRTILDKQQQVLRSMVERMNPTMTPPELEANEGMIRSALTSTWQTDPHPEVRPTVSDELEHALFFLTDILFRVVPPFFESLRCAAVSAYGASAEQDFRLPPVLRFGSWVGGDMDGNPNVGPETIDIALAEQRNRIVRLYKRSTERLAGDLSQCANQIDVSPQVLNRLRRYQQLLPEQAASIPARHADMPYRCLLVLMTARLDAIRDQEPGGYRTSAEFTSDLLAIRESLRANKGGNAGMFAVNRLLMQARTFGFHLATLDVRQDARVLREALAEGFGDADWPSRSADERVERLQSALESGEVPQDRGPKLQRCLEIFSTVNARIDEYGPRAIGAFIISMCEDADDILTVLLLARWGGCVDDAGFVPLDVAPLFETLDDLHRAPAVLRRLFALPVIQAHLEGRENQQMVMLGYSDSNKDAGILASRVALHSAQQQLGEACQENAIQLTVFHGRGGSISRGGGRLAQGVKAIPAIALNGRLRATEQGEAIDQKFGIRGLALRNLEQMTSATLLALAENLKAPVISTPNEWVEALEQAAAASRTKYRQLLEHPNFIDYFQQATPIDVIERLRIASRPARRRGPTDISALRAIPWVFAWAQSRHVLPGWYGVGTGLAAARQLLSPEQWRQAYEQWPFLTALADDVEMVLAKGDLNIASKYAELADESGQEIFAMIEDEHQRTVSELRLLTGSELLDHDPVLKRAIRLRNPYVDPLSLLQVELLKRWRATDRRDDELFEALTETLRGVAEGLQNTG